MSLDVVLLNPSGSPERTASIGVDAHYRMFEQLRGSYPLLHRMADYYEDAAYAPDEVPVLRDEVLVARQRATDDTEVQRFFDELLVLLALAREKSTGIDVIAD